MVVITAGFLVLAVQSEMDKAREQAEAASQSAAEKQKESAEKIVKVNPIKKIRELNALGKYQEAVDLARQVAEKFPGHAKLQTWWGISLVKLGKRAEAIDHFILASEKDSTDEKAHLYWGLTLAMDEKFADAIAHYKTVLEINPEHSNAYAYWGTSLSAMGKMEGAVAKLEESLTLNRFNRHAYEILIDVLYQRQQYERAWEMVRRARAANVAPKQSSIDRLAKASPESAQK